MNRSKLTTNIIEHREHLDDHFKQVNETGEPLFVTVEGETTAVVLSPDAFEKLSAEAELARSRARVMQSIEDIKAGRVHPAKQAIEEIANEFGLTLERRQAS